MHHWLLTKKPNLDHMHASRVCPSITPCRREGTTSLVVDNADVGQGMDTSHAHVLKHALQEDNISLMDDADVGQGTFNTCSSQTLCRRTKFP